MKTTGKRAQQMQRSRVRRSEVEYLQQPNGRVFNLHKMTRKVYGGREGWIWEGECRKGEGWGVTDAIFIRDAKIARVMGVGPPDRRMGSV